MAELVDAPDLGSGPVRGDGFESLYPHHTLVEPSRLLVYPCSVKHWVVGNSIRT